MIAVMFFAVMVDRPAISLHNLADGGGADPAPVAGTGGGGELPDVLPRGDGAAAFFEWWNARVPQEFAPARGLLWRMGRKVVLVAAASLATSFIAGTLSSIPAAHHFGRVAPYSVISNALALPVVSHRRDAHGAAGRTAYAVRT
jgi:competence protein ComEC